MQSGYINIFIIFLIKISHIQKAQTHPINQFRVNLFCMSLEVNEKSFLPVLNWLKINLKYTKLAASAKNTINLYNVFGCQSIAYNNNRNSHLYTLLVKNHAILGNVNNLRKLYQVK